MITDDQSSLLTRTSDSAYDLLGKALSNPEQNSILCAKSNYDRLRGQMEAVTSMDEPRLKDGVDFFLLQYLVGHQICSDLIEDSWDDGESVPSMTADEVITAIDDLMLQENPKNRSIRNLVQQLDLANDYAGSLRVLEHVREKYK